MQGSEKVIEILNKLLLGEWQARRQYEAIAETFGVMEYGKLAAEYRERAEDEAGHTVIFHRRIVELDGEITTGPDPVPLLVNDIVGQIKASLDIENKARADLQEGIRICESESDFGTRSLLRKILSGEKSEEEHIIEIEADLAQIEREGLDNWLSTQR